MRDGSLAFAALVWWRLWLSKAEDGAAVSCEADPA